MYPSTLWSSFPKRPQGLNVMLHLSPVLPHNHKLFTNPLSWKLSSINYPVPLLKLSQFCCLHQYAESESKSTPTLPSWDVQVCKTDWRRVCFHRQQGQQKAREPLLLMVDDLHAAILLNPKLTDDDVVHTACGVCPGVGLIVSVEKNAWGQWGITQQVHSRLKTELTWAAPAWSHPWVQLLYSSPKTWVWGKWSRGTQNPPGDPQLERHWLGGDG